MARWLTSPFASDAQARGIFPVRPVATEIQTEDTVGGSDELGILLGAIADEVHRHAAAAREGISADFAARASHARKHLSRNLLMATLAAIKEQRKAAMALIGRNAALEIAGRSKAAIDALGKNPSRRSKRGPQSNSSDPAPKL